MVTVHRLPARTDAGGAKPFPSSPKEQAPAWSAGRVHAICFDLDTRLAAHHHPTGSDTSAYGIIARVFQGFGFHRQQGSVFFGEKETTPVDCVLATQALVAQYPWMRFVIKDIRMLRIEENNDLSAALGRQADLLSNMEGR